MTQFLMRIATPLIPVSISASMASESNTQETAPLTRDEVEGLFAVELGRAMY